MDRFCDQFKRLETYSYEALMRYSSRDSSSVMKFYKKNKELYDNQKAELSKRSTWISHTRFVFFLVATIATGAGLWDLGQPEIWLLVVGGMGFVGFLALVGFHHGILQNLEKAIGLAFINAQALARVAREYEHLPVPKLPEHFTEGSLPNDLDLFGKSSLFQLIGTVRTPPGRSCLADWLSQPANPSEIAYRQQAVIELSPNTEDRQRIQLLGEQLSENPADTAPFIHWAESSPWLSNKKSLIVAIRSLSILTLTFVVLHAMDWVQVPLWLPFLLINLGITGRYAKRLTQSFSTCEEGERSFSCYAKLFAMISGMPASSEKLQSIISTWGRGELSAHKQMKKLGSLLKWIDLRRSAMAYFPVQALCLWDFHWLLHLESWQKNAGGHVRSWFHALGELEALSALAGLAYDHPHWCLPEIRTSGEFQLDATALGHPLLKPSKCVCNDVHIGPPGSFLLVTGSNMSGKSTMLRAIGVNMVLAFAGAPVCAGSLKLPPLSIGTSFRIRDSLEKGVSYFFAELKQLKSVVDQARAHSQTKESCLLFLFDEILLGTNVAERQIAVQRILDLLMKMNAIGAIATHDLSLADHPACSPVFFCERFREEKNATSMVFDYKLRPGLCPTTNALRLLSLVGLDSETP
jgi:hypothetical protein